MRTALAGRWRADRWLGDMSLGGTIGDLPLPDLLDTLFHAWRFGLAGTSLLA